MQNGKQNAMACPISLHVPTSALQFGPDILDFGGDSASASSSSTASSASTATAATPAPPTPRRPHPGGLDTLPEASHVNALVDAQGPSPAALPGPSSSSAKRNIDSLVGDALQGLSPSTRSLAVSRSKGYCGITVELTNERWRERWSRLCLAGADVKSSSNGNMGTTSPVKAFKEGNPGGMGGSWELLAHLSGASGLGIPYEKPAGKMAMPRSSSRGLLAAKQREEPPRSPAKDEASASSKSLSHKSREAEYWRQIPTFHRGELTMTKYEETDGVTAVISPWLELDSPDEGIRFDSEIALRQELAYASHIGITQVILPPPSSDPACRAYLPDYARAIAGCLLPRGSEAPAAGLFMKLAIRLPISSPYNLAQTMIKNGETVSSSGSTGSVSPAQLRSDDDWAWQTWHIIESLCQYDSRLSVALDLSAPLPASFALQRWTSQPVSHVWLPARAFLSNAKGYPVLSKASQNLLRSLLTMKAPGLRFIIVGSQSPPSHHTRGGQAAYEQYIRHLEKSLPTPSAVDVQSRGYADYLQAPLQPLFDDLEGQTYATFEADAIKYVKYEEAVFQALLSKPHRSTQTIWVCGAGRGPLVDRCLKAAKRAGKSVKIVAVEKNVNAIVGLRERAALEWGEDTVEVRLADMRKMRTPKDKADIIVSELLGSFGDNELSPECLDGAVRFLKPDGICIPRAYTSYITPISTPKLHAEVLKAKAVASSSSSVDRAKPISLLTKAVETPYVVLLRAFTNLAAQGGRQDWAEVQNCWTFEHEGMGQGGVVLDADDLPVTNSHNVRSSVHTFHIPHQGVCHGLAGYFEAHLFGDVVLSIHPDPMRATKDMMSWFPIFFPFKDPIYLASNSELDVHLWRLSSSSRVWYEWMAEAFVCMPKASSATMGSLSAMTHPGGSTNQRNTSGSSDAASTDAAFQNAPLTPRIAEMGLGLPSGAARGGAASQQQNGWADSTLLAVKKAGGEEMTRRLSSGSGQGGSSMGKVEDVQIERLRVGMSAQMNVGGRSSWVGM